MAPVFPRKETACVLAVVGLLVLLPTLQAFPTLSTHDLPTSRWDAGAAAWNDHVYAIGGRVDYGSHPKSLDAVLVASVSSNGSLGPWQFEPAPLPDVRGHLTVEVWGDHLYAIGGHRIDGDASGESTVWEATLSPNGSIDSWTRQANLPFATFKHASVVVGDILYVTGGSTGWGPRADVAWAVIQDDGEIRSWHDGPDLPHAREEHGLLAREDALYVLGGKSPDRQPEDRILKAPIHADGTLGSWRNIGNWSGTRQSAGYALTGNGGLVVGGREPGQYTVYRASVLRVNLSEGGFESDHLGQLPHHIHSSAVAGTSNLLYSIGGSRGANDPTSNVTGIRLNESINLEPELDGPRNEDARGDDTDGSENGSGEESTDGDSGDGGDGDQPQNESPNPNSTGGQDPPLPDTKIARTLQDHPEILTHARTYEDIASRIQAILDPVTDAIESILGIRSDLRDLEFGGHSAWDAITQAEPSIRVAFEGLDTLHGEMEDVRRSARDVETAANRTETAVSDYQANPTPENEERVKASFEEAIPAYRDAAGRMQGSADRIDSGRQGIDLAVDELNRHRDKPFVGGAIGSAADGLNRLSSSLSSGASQLRDAAGQLEGDAGIMENALEEGLFAFLPAPAWTTVLAAGAAAAWFHRRSRRLEGGRF